jgi:hypothetical protein
MPLLFVILLGVFTISIICWGDSSKTAVANLGYLVCYESSLAKKCKRIVVVWVWRRFALTILVLVYEIIGFP